jgi:hypothetical protein
MKAQLLRFMKTKTGKLSTIIISLFLLIFIFSEFIYHPFFEWYTGVKNGKLTFNSSKKISDDEFENLARELTYQDRLKRAEEQTKDEKNEFSRKVKIEMLMNTSSFLSKTNYSHIKYFRDAGIRQYEGPKTCLKCHEEMKVHKSDGSVETVNTMEDVVESVHFQFQRMAAGFSTYGYNGKKVNEEGRPIPVGKIDRACGIPGSFSWTGWAALIATKPDSLNGAVVYRSEGCGACHIGGNYQPATEDMMPIGEVPNSAKEGIDCLICHSQSYDMNYKYVIKDNVGYRWNQDRTMRAAMTVTKPSNDNCLNCHQHNMGGDTYAHNISAKNLGYKNKRVIHEGSKRGNPFSPEDDVHYAAGIKCIDCHIPEGHKIPRGTKGTDLVANDLPGKSVACENCHTSAPHTKNELTRVILNGHVARIACETCHIKNLEDESVVLRDWVNPTWDSKEGMYTPTDVLRSGKSNIGFTYLWFNGNGTFLANALGNNPNKTDKYNPLMDQITKISNPEALKEVKENLKKYFNMNDTEINNYLKSVENTLSQLPPEMIEKRREVIARNLLPIENMGESKIYPFKMFNAYMYEDRSNQGPFGAMILPFDYTIYYETGEPMDAVIKAIQNPIVKRMYQLPFKKYMMDDFMHYFGVDNWSTTYPLNDKGELRNVKPNWMRQFGTLMVNHGIQKEGLSCQSCHSEKGILDFKKLGYSPERIKDLQHLPELKYFKKENIKIAEKKVKKNLISKN